MISSDNFEDFDTTLLKDKIKEKKEMLKETSKFQNDFYSFIVNAGLYDKIFIPTEYNFEYISKIRREFEQVDIYCIGCSKESIFSEILSYRNIHESMAKKSNDEIVINNKPLFDLHLSCNRKCGTEYVFTFRIKQENNKTSIQKIGQFPALHDLAAKHVKKYKKILNNDFIELQTALRLHSVGVGVGAFVYLRRIFENLIFNTYNNNKNNTLICEEDFIRLRMNEKIDCLKEYLPEFLVENSRIYGILSLGIHELKEDDCLNIFDIIEKSIEMILDEILIKKEKQNKRDELSKAISSIKFDK